MLLFEPLPWKCQILIQNYMFYSFGDVILLRAFGPPENKKRIKMSLKFANKISKTIFSFSTFTLRPLDLWETIRKHYFWVI